MKTSRFDPSPWSDASPREKAAADRLLAAAKAFVPPVQVTFADIQGAVRKQRHSMAATPARLLLAGAVAAGVVVVTGGVALSRGWLARREPAAPTLVTVPAGATARVERRGRFRMSLRGPGAVEIRNDARNDVGNDQPSLRLDEGELRVESGEHAVVVQATGRNVELSPSSTVTLEITTPGMLRVDTTAGAEPRIGGTPLSHGAPPGVSVAPRPGTTGDRRGAAAPSVATTPASAPAMVSRVAPGPPAVAETASTIGRERSAPVVASRAGTETAQIRDALARLRTEKNPAQALELLDRYDRRFPAGLWHDEAAVIRIEALLALGRSAEALERFETIPQASIDRSPRLRVARGELRASHGRCDQALADFDALLALPVEEDRRGEQRVGAEIERRATRGRAACRKMRGEVDPGL